MYVFGGHTVPDPQTSLEISNELFVLDLQSMNWKRLAPTALPLAYMANTVLQDEARLAMFGGLTQDAVSNGKFKATNEIVYLDLKTGNF